MLEFMIGAQTPLPVQVSTRARTDSLSRAAHADSVAARGGTFRSDTTFIVKHHFNHRQQIITGSVIMACLATMVVVMNNYNPQGPNQ